jgi:tRNA-(ms[2]io[6]A)-hydroxylase
MLAEALRAQLVAGLVGSADDPRAAAEALAALTPAESVRVGVMAVLLPLVALALAAGLGGALVGRFGGEAGKKEATLAGAAAAAVTGLLAGVSALGAEGLLAWLMSTAVVMIAAALAARGGALGGLRKRR